MSPLLDEINALIDAPSVDRDRVERTLMDGYAHALTLEAERWRLEKRVGELTLGLRRGEEPVSRSELSTLTTRLDGTTVDLSRLRGQLAQLRRRSSAARRNARSG
jgi:hypothetical protein